MEYIGFIKQTRYSALNPLVVYSLARYRTIKRLQNGASNSQILHHDQISYQIRENPPLDHLPFRDLSPEIWDIDHEPGLEELSFVNG
jgi:hypothetical protein